MTDSVVVVLPLKNFVDAKTRLSPALSPDERLALFAAMAEDVLDAIANAALPTGILLVSQDPRAATLATQYGAELLSEPLNLGQTNAVTLAAETLTRRGTKTMLALPADIPLISAAEIDEILQKHGVPPSISIAPAHDRQGSNAVACSPPNALPFRFGNHSFAPHLRAARELGIEPRIIELKGAALDIDTPADLAVFEQTQSSQTRAHATLARIRSAC